MKSLFGYLREKSRRSSVFASLLLSVLCIMLVPIASNITVFIAGQWQLNSQITTANLEKFGSFTRKMDQMYAGAYQTVMRMSSSELLSEYLQGSERNYYKEYEIRLQLRETVGSKGPLSMCYVYLPQYDYVIYDEGGMGSHYFYDRMYRQGYEDWLGAMELAGSTITISYWPVHPGGVAGNVLKAVPQKDGTGLAFVAAVQLSERYILDEIVQLGLDPNSGITLLSSSRVVASTLPQEDSMALYGYLNSGAMEASDQLTTGKTTYQLHAAPLERYGLRAVYTTSTNLPNTPRSYIFYTTLYAFLLCILLTVLLGVYFSKIHTKRIRGIMAMLSDSPAHDPSAETALAQLGAQHTQGALRQRNEYVIVESLVRNTIHNYNTLSDIVGGHAEELMEAYFQKTLQGEEADPGVILETFRLYGHPMKHPRFVLLACRYAASKPHAAAEDLAALCVLMPQACEAALPKRHRLYTGVHKGTVVCLANLAENGENALPEPEADALLAAFWAVLPQERRPQFVLEASHAYIGIEHTHAICEELLDQLDESEMEMAARENTLPEWMERCMHLIHTHYADQNLSTSSLAEALNITRPHLSLNFKQYAGIGLHEEIQRYRIYQAKRLMQSTHSMNLMEIADMSGFSSVESLIRNFKKYEGTTPGRLRDTQHGRPEKTG